MTRRSHLASAFAAAVACAGTAFGQPSATAGGLLLLEQCPTSAPQTVDPPAQESLLPILTPIVQGVVGRGLSIAHQRLTDAAKQARIDVLHRGDHMYKWADGRFVVAHQCVVLWTRGTMKRDRGLGSLTVGYPDPSTNASQNGVEGTRGNGDENDRSNPLHAQLAGHIDDNTRRPAVVAVFDVQLSSQRTAARLVPRFVSMDHSARDKKRDSRPRTIAFQFAYSLPGVGAPSGAPLVKIDNLVAGQAFAGEPLENVTSTWFALPEIPAPATARAAAFRDAAAQTDAELEAALVSAAVAAKFEDDDAALYLASADSRPVAQLCPTRRRTNGLLLDRSVALAVARLEPETEETKRRIAKLDNAARFFGACARYHKADAVRRQFEFPAGDSDEPYVDRPFDLEVTVTEFRKRPFVEFWGSVLGDKDTRTGLATAIGAGMDPATRAARQATAEAELHKSLEAFEAAMVAAETATAGYEAATDENTKRAASIAMEAAKRTANRLAQQLGRPLPYPDSGLWFP